jgi:hypothetical protein
MLLLLLPFWCWLCAIAAVPLLLLLLLLCLIEPVVNFVVAAQRLEAVEVAAAE